MKLLQQLFKSYFSVPLMIRILGALFIGVGVGIGLWVLGERAAVDVARIIGYVSPLGMVFVYMLKMIVIPVIFFSLLQGASSLPLKKFGIVGVKVLGWYLLTSVVAAIVGTGLALAINPGARTDSEQWQEKLQQLSVEDSSLAGGQDVQETFIDLLYSLFQNPFQALAQGNFLPIIVFTILIGLAIRVCIENANTKDADKLHMLLDVANAAGQAMFKLVEWVLEYAPVGVLALTMTNFALYGPTIAGPYVTVTLGVVVGIAFMICVTYAIMLWVVTKQNPLRIFKYIQEAMIMAFVTRSSAATLPVSLQIASDELRIKPELSGFSLPLGATINMDGVCVHLPMFAILAANMFGLEMTAQSLFILVMTTVLASVGAGGVPGGSLLLLLIILRMMGLDDSQSGVIIALALGINPVLDMFETMNNVTGDLVCTYAVAHSEKFIVDQA